MTSNGEIDIHLKNHILFITVLGSCDVQIFKQSFDRIKNIISEKPTGEFSIIVDLTHWELNESEVKMEFEDIRPWLIEHGQKYEVLAVGQSNFKKLESMKYFLGFDDSLSVHYCATVNEGKEWLKTNHML